MFLPSRGQLETKERIDSVEAIDEEENNERLVLLSDNLERLQAEIARVRFQLSADKNEWEKF